MGDGIADDMAAMNKAASDGARCDQLCEFTTVTGALVYFPVYSPHFFSALFIISLMLIKLPPVII